MKKKNRIISVIMVVLISIVSTCFPISANAQVGGVSATETNDKVLFSELFFNRQDDVNKVIGYFDSDIANGAIPQTHEIDVNQLIETLGSQTNYNETVCIIDNLRRIDEYVEEEKINDATTGSSLSDPFGGMLTKDMDAQPGIQPLWNKDTVHKNKTTEIAKKYFSSTVATKIGNYDREVDIKYSSGWGAITGSANQYIHFNQYASGSEDSRDYAATTWFVACSLAWQKGQKENAYMYLGYALHPLQDKESHGQIGRGKSVPQHLVSYTSGDNITHADDETGWEWTNSSRNALKKVSGSRVRYNAAVSVTDKYLKQYAGILK